MEKKIYSGKEFEMNDNYVQEKRIEKKYITENVANKLLVISVKNRDQIGQTIFANAIKCQHILGEVKGKLHGRYCKQRICLICNDIRKAKLINKYWSAIKGWPDPHFVTITVLPCQANRLKSLIDEMFTKFSSILNSRRMDVQRKNIKNLSGLRSLECKFNEETKTFNPHFHLIVPDEYYAKTIIEEWKRKWQPGLVKDEHQQCKRIKNKENDLMYTLKYICKIFDYPVDAQGKVNNHSQYYFPAALYRIISVMRRRRLLVAFGLKNLELEEKISQPEKAPIERQWRYEAAEVNWIDRNTGEFLFNYTPNHELMNKLNHDHRLDGN